MLNPLIECVPNFSEGRDPHKIKQVTDQIEKVRGIKLLNVDSGKGTNRTVVTFVGQPDAVIEAAFRAIKKAAEVIDMRYHRGEHPRMGATDVCPLVPISGIGMDEIVEYAHRLGYRVGEELGIPGYYYEYAALQPYKKSLSDCRSGEYEGLSRKMEDPKWKPDFGPAVFNPKTGATVIGARDFLVAYNINLNTTSTRRANSVAFDIREKGRVKRTGDPLTGEIERDEKGAPVYIPGSLQAVKAIGWYIEEFGIAQVSLNLTNLNVTPIHVAFDETCARAEAHGLRVTGSELIGLVPLKTMVEAGKYFLRKQKRSLGVPEDEIIQMAIRSLGLNELSPFNPKERIIEYLLGEGNPERLANMTLKKFADETSSELPAPGGGSVAAYAGALAASLGIMVANVSAHKKGWDDRWEEFSIWAEKGQVIKNKLLKLVDEDTKAFEGVLIAMKLPKETQPDIAVRTKAIENATKQAIEIPLTVMKLVLEAMDIIRYSAANGLKSSVTDAGVGGLMAKAAIEGAVLNVRINCKSLDDTVYVSNILKEAYEIMGKAILIEMEIAEMVEKNLS
jgi:glutamate formiminotransferase/formiminotetrahydrofolate cyclodeaminase